MPVFDCATGEVRPETEAEILARQLSLEQVKTDAIDSLKNGRDLAVSAALSLADGDYVPADFSDRVANHTALCHEVHRGFRSAVLIASSRDDVNSVMAGVEWPIMDIEP